MVDVSDGSAEETGIPLGRADLPDSGGPEHRYVLVGGGSFAARLGRDVVAALRARGYQARGRSDTRLDASQDAIVLTIKEVTHSIDLAIGKSDVVFKGALVFVNKQHFGWSKARTFEGVYWSAVVEIVHRFSTALPPSP